MSVGFNASISGSGSGLPKMDPDAYAQEYADKNGISLEEAKAELKAKYGDPQQQASAASSDSGSIWSSGNAASTDSTSTDDATKLVTDYLKTANREGVSPDDFVSQVAQATGVNETIVKTIVQNYYGGDPEQQQEGQNLDISA